MRRVAGSVNTHRIKASASGYTQGVLRNLTNSAEYVVRAKCWSPGGGYSDYIEEIILPTSRSGLSRLNLIVLFLQYGFFICMTFHSYSHWMLYAVLFS